MACGPFWCGMDVTAPLVLAPGGCGGAADGHPLSLGFEVFQGFRCTWRRTEDQSGAGLGQQRLRFSGRCCRSSLDRPACRTVLAFPAWSRCLWNGAADPGVQGSMNRCQPNPALCRPSARNGPSRAVRCGFCPRNPSRSRSGSGNNGRYPEEGSVCLRA